MANTLSDQEVVEEIESLDSIPEEYTPGLGALYPGLYVFKTPNSFKDLFSTYKSKYGKPNEDKVEREFVRLRFKGETALTVLKVVEGGDESRVNTPFNTDISNQPRSRGKEKVQISDMTYFYKALGGTVVPKTNSQVITEVSKLAGKAFKAHAEYTGFCNPKRQIYVQDPESGKSVPGLNEDGSVKNGCGNRIYGSNWPKVDGKFANMAGCACGAVIRPFNGLSGFGPANG